MPLAPLWPFFNSATPAPFKLSPSTWASGARPSRIGPANFIGASASTPSTPAVWKRRLTPKPKPAAAKPPTGLAAPKSSDLPPPPRVGPQHCHPGRPASARVSASQSSTIMTPTQHPPSLSPYRLSPMIVPIAYDQTHYKTTLRAPLDETHRFPRFSHFASCTPASSACSSVRCKPRSKKVRKFQFWRRNTTEHPGTPRKYSAVLSGTRGYSEAPCADAVTRVGRNCGKVQPISSSHSPMRFDALPLVL